MANPEPAPRRPLRALLGVVLGELGRWGPLALALGLFAQIALLGLRPALAERARLGRAEAELDLRLEGVQQRQRELGALRGALQDPVYRERLRLQRAGDDAAR